MNTNMALTHFSVLMSCMKVAAALKGLKGVLYRNHYIFGLPAEV